MGTQEVTLPAEVFSTLRRELSREVGPNVALRVLRETGYQAGVQLAVELGATDPELGRAASGTSFWTRIEDHFRRRGWGTLRHDGTHRGVGLLTSSDWSEPFGSGPHPDPEGNCSFSTGLLSGLLTSMAGGPVAVLEVQCRARGDDQCTFAFGSETAIQELYGRLLDGTALDRALAEL